MSKFFYFIVIIVGFLSILQPVDAVVCGPLTTPGNERCATCDLCGLCQKDGVITYNSGNWEKCRNCLYPTLTGAPASQFETLKIDATDNIPPTPVFGAHYTMIGCVNTGSGGFTDSQGTLGSSTLANKLLDFIFKMVGAVAFLYLLFGAFVILTSQTNPEKLAQGKAMVIGALVGLVFALMSIFIVSLIGGGILKIPGFASPTPAP